MLIKQIVIDGFKSYANRVVIDNWDESFNAITGLNGSGKSNILDAICFVLGITSLSHVRARDLNDLIYKQGTTRVTKASVSILFDNRDKSQSPIGYEDRDEFTLTRQIAVNQRGKYLIDGHVAQQGKVQMMLQSVQLNVNNPHFLIMQGRVTKVCGMKPEELLGLLEESSGTRMYNQKRLEAVTLLTRKETKVKEVNEVLRDNVQKTMETLRNDKAKYVTYVSNATTIERLQRFCAAADYVQSSEELERAETDLAQNEQDGRDAEASRYRIKNELEALATAVAERERSISAEIPRELQDEQNKRGRAVARTRQEIVNTRQAAEGERKAAQKHEAAVVAAEKQVAQHAAKLAKARARREDAVEAHRVCQERIDSLQSSLLGLSVGDAAGGGGGGTLLAQQMAANKAIADTQADIDAATTRLHQLTAERRRATADAEREKKTFAAVERDLARAMAALEVAEKRAGASQAELASSGKGTLAAQRVKAEQSAADGERDTMHLRSEISRLEAAVSARTTLRFTPWAGLQGGQIKGTVAALVSVRDARFADALEVAAGPRLSHVVVDNEVTATDLLRRGQLQNRTTMVPLTKVQARVLSPQQIATAAALSNGIARPAMELVTFDPAMRKAVEYALGNVFVCDDLRTAELVAFNREINTRCVTLQGDVVDPSGTISGGALPQGGGVLTQSAEAQRLRAQLAERDTALAAMRQAVARFDDDEQLARELASAQEAVRSFTQRRDQTQYAELSAQANALTAEIGEVEGRIQSLKQNKTHHETRAKDLKTRIETLESGSKAKQKDLDKEIVAAQKALPGLEDAAKAAADAAERVEQEERVYAEEIERLRGLIAAATAAAAERDNEARTLEDTLVRQEEEQAEIDARVAEARAAIEHALGALQAMRDQCSTLKTELSQVEVHTRALTSQRKELSELRGTHQRALEKLLRVHKFITADRARFGEAGSDYDFAAHDPDERRKELARLQVQQAQLQNGINKNVMGMFEKAEAEYNDLVKKRDIIVADKQKIEATIKDLDERKREALDRTWSQVNAAFGQIFSTLLPGAGSKLEKHTAATGEIKGVEMKVSFSGVWKASLSELSGGQRSLLALSLILAMLKFSPAPLYILDEVDAALDLSHTQNIGIMLKEQFPEAQFIVVSLKEGMFNNANVLFRTKFVDGVSTVARIVNKKA